MSSTSQMYKAINLRAKELMHLTSQRTTDLPLKIYHQTFASRITPVIPNIPMSVKDMKKYFLTGISDSCSWVNNSVLSVVM